MYFKKVFIMNDSNVNTSLGLNAAIFAGYKTTLSNLDLIPLSSKPYQLDPLLAHPEIREKLFAVIRSFRPDDAPDLHVTKKEIQNLTKDQTETLISYGVKILSSQTTHFIWKSLGLVKTEYIIEKRALELLAERGISEDAASFTELMECIQEALNENEQTPYIDWFAPEQKDELVRYIRKNFDDGVEYVNLTPIQKEEVDFYAKALFLTNDLASLTSDQKWQITDLITKYTDNFFDTILEEKENVDNLKSHEFIIRNLVTPLAELVSTNFGTAVACAAFPFIAIYSIVVGLLAGLNFIRIKTKHFFIRNIYGNLSKLLLSNNISTQFHSSIGILEDIRNLLIEEGQQLFSSDTSIKDALTSLNTETPKSNIVETLKTKIDELTLIMRGRVKVDQDVYYNMRVQQLEQRITGLGKSQALFPYAYSISLLWEKAYFILSYPYALVVNAIANHITTKLFQIEDCDGKRGIIQTVAHSVIDSLVEGLIDGYNLPPEQGGHKTTVSAYELLESSLSDLVGNGTFVPLEESIPKLVQQSMVKSKGSDLEEMSNVYDLLGTGAYGIANFFTSAASTAYDVGCSLTGRGDVAVRKPNTPPSTFDSLKSVLPEVAAVFEAGHEAFQPRWADVTTPVSKVISDPLTMLDGHTLGSLVSNTLWNVTEIFRVCTLSGAVGAAISGNANQATMPKNALDSLITAKQKQLNNHANRETTTKLADKVLSQISKGVRDISLLPTIKASPKGSKEKQKAKVEDFERRVSHGIYTARSLFASDTVFKGLQWALGNPRQLEEFRSKAAIEDALKSYREQLEASLTRKADGTVPILHDALLKTLLNSVSFTGA